jgi:hypothetical protein
MGGVGSGIKGHRTVRFRRRERSERTAALGGRYVPHSHRTAKKTGLIGRIRKKLQRRAAIAEIKRYLNHKIK